MLSAERIHHTLARMFAEWHLASAKIVKSEFNANLDLLGFPHFITFNECRKELKENDTKNLVILCFLMS